MHLLGMGGGGHINSLFPHTAATAETERLVVGVEDSPKPPPRRITDAASRAASREVWLVVSGEAKGGGGRCRDRRRHARQPPVRSAGTPRCGCSTPPAAGKLKR